MRAFHTTYACMKCMLFRQKNNFAGSSIVQVKNVMISSCCWWRFLTATSAIVVEETLSQTSLTPLACEGAGEGTCLRLKLRVGSKLTHDKFGEHKGDCLKPILIKKKKKRFTSAFICTRLWHVMYSGSIYVNPCGFQNYAKFFVFLVMTNLRAQTDHVLLKKCSPNQGQSELARFDDVRTVCNRSFSAMYPWLCGGLLIILLLHMISAFDWSRIMVWFYFALFCNFGFG